MAGTGTAFDEFIAEEVKKYKGIYVPVRAGILRRAIFRKARLSRLHPNPDDEFCMPKVGPNYQIISDYMQSFSIERAHSKDYCEEPLPFPVSRIYKERLRLGIPALFRYLNKKGYDIWVYSAGYYSADYIQRLFKKHHAHICGAVTGTGRKTADNMSQTRKELEGLIANTYQRTVHIDNDAVHPLAVSSVRRPAGRDRQRRTAPQGSSAGS